MGRRDPYWDNIRCLAGCLVLFMHVAGGLVVERDGLRWLFFATWAVRIPLFALLAGYFSGAEPLTRRSAWRLAVTLLVPCYAVELLGRVQIWAMRRQGAPWQDWWTNEIPGPRSMLWFLLALFVWRLALPYLARLRHPLALSVGVSLAAGCLPWIGEDTQWARTLAFLPFFVLGWRLRQRGATAVWGRGTAWAVLGAAAAVSWLAAVRYGVDREWLMMRHPYGTPWDWAGRGAALLGGIAVALSVLRVMPHRSLPVVTYLGTGGMFIYVLQPLVLRPVASSGVVDGADTWAAYGLLPVLSLALAAGLASPPVRRLTRPIVQPRWWSRPGKAATHA